jgi:SAM-dependent methyltransferase
VEDFHPQPGKQEPAPQPVKQDPSPAELFQQKLFNVLGGAMTSSLIALGDTLNIYKTMKELGKLSCAELADACKLSERFVREWLHQQACAGVISTNSDATAFWLDDAQQAVLANEHGSDASPLFMGGLFQHIPELMACQPKLLDAFRSGQGFTYDDMGSTNVCATCRSLGVWVRHFLVKRLGSLPGMTEALERGITVADVGCGAGELLFTLARAFPKGRYHGYDISQQSVDAANKRKQDADFKDLDISFLNPAKGQGLPDAPTYDLVITMDAVHDMARPDQVVPLVRKALKDDALGYIINDPRGKPTPAQNIAEEPERSMVYYGFSCYACLPSGMSEPGGLGYGALGFQEKQARELATASGFSGFEVITDKFQSHLNNVFLLKP